MNETIQILLTRRAVRAYENKPVSRADLETIVQREIFLDGKNVCRVNGSLVTVSILRKLGIQLINIHGQHDSASLFDEDNHLAFLDAFAGNEALRSDYGEKYETDPGPGRK